jgi:ribosomal protein S18 acetylase RimI-like enzyme
LYPFAFMNQEISITRVSEFSPNLAKAIRTLAKQLGDNYQELTDQDLQEIIESPMHNLFIAVTSDGKIAGMFLVMVYRIPYLRKAYLEDLIVDNTFRGKGFGRLLLEHGLEFAKSQGAAYADLTSKHDRIASNALYEKLGFQKREANVYRKIFTYGKQN